MTVLLAPIDLSTGTILSDEVYSRIGAAILDGTLVAGAHLRDTDLALQLGVSRTPVREALQRLERFGLVEVAVGRYTRVSEPDDRLREETGVFTAYLMGNALRMALSEASEEELDGILHAADAVVDSARAGVPLLVFEASAAMFELVTLATHNGVFIGVVREAGLAIQRNLRGWTPFVAGPLARADDYLTLRAQIAARDADGAERTLRTLHGVG
ncbi:GntR family transcriptional regulator [Microbacterium sp.]|uniref:GntR family transcriptional regulator n=1 Tax=Microbacterium sp. TaxID=51671 RepID=UPI0039E63B4C